VVAEAGTGEEAVVAARRHDPDVVLMDIRMPGLDGIEATRRLPGHRVLILTTFGLDEYIIEALRAGASGFLLKDSRPDDLLSAIRSVAAGDAVMAPSATRRLLDTVVPMLPSAQKGQDSRLEVLTDREREVLVEIAKGATNAEISTSLYMAEGTVKTHIGRLLAKLHARDRVQLVLIAYEAGLTR
jgi:DNA-binding NarL/FixJ family response regulator